MTDPQASSPGSPTPESVVQASQAAILVVDDEPMVRGVVCHALEGFVCLEAASAEAARTVLAGNPSIHLILLDLGMPGMGGEAFLEWLQEHHPDIEVVIASAHCDEQSVVRCLAKGASDFLEKPFRTERITKVVRRVFRRKSRRSLGPRKTATSLIRATTPAEGWVELTAPSEFEYLNRMQRFADVLFASRLSHEDCEDLRMAMEEIGRNAIEWGNRMDPQKCLQISYCFFKDRIVLKFEDEGEGFHPETLPDPSEDPAGLVQRRMAGGKRPGGFGVFLVHNIMDEVVYSEKGNVVLMTKFFH